MIAPNAISTLRIVANAQVSAVGKYCYVVPSEKELDFGSQTIVAAGGPSVGNRGGLLRKEFTLRNQSVVPAAFTVSGRAACRLFKHCSIAVTLVVKELSGIASTLTCDENHIPDTSLGLIVHLRRGGFERQPKKCFKLRALGVDGGCSPTVCMHICIYKQLAT